MSLPEDKKKNGWLTKQGAKFKNWKNRFFVLDGKMLKYFKTETAPKPQGIVNLSTATDVALCAIPKFPGKPTFKIDTPGRTYFLVAETEIQRDSWIEAISMVLKEIQVPSPKPQMEQLTTTDFDLLSVIGKGSFGKVMQVRCKRDNKIYAMKMLSKQHIIDNNEIEHTMAEKETLAKLKHPFLVNLNYSFQTEDKLFFILDFVNGGELFFHLQNEQFFDENRTRFYSAEILLALEALHSSGIIYRDLKPENLLLNYDGHICVTDFGLCKSGLNKTAKTDTFCGTPEYLAPEVLKGDAYGFEVDWWSFGSLIFEMLTGFPPFFSEDPKELYKKIVSAPVQFPDKMSEEAKGLIGKLLERDPKKRLCDSAEMKKQPFFEGIDWDLLIQKKVQPPFVPQVKDSTDVSHIDPAFTEEAPNTELPSKGELIEEDLQRDFSGFTYFNKT